MAGRSSESSTGPAPPLARANWADALTLTRLALAPALVLSVLQDALGMALACFAVACVTDIADGRVARRLELSSPRGALFDHAADAIFVSMGLGALAARGLLPALLPVLVAVAFAQYVIDSAALRGRDLRASPLGRWNGIAYFVLLGTPLVRDNLGLGWPGDGLLHGLGWALVVTTLVSMADRLMALVRAPRD